MTTTIDSTVLGRLFWYELLTTDMKAAESFYQAVVGWTAAPFEGAAAPYTVLSRAGGVQVAGLMPIPEGMNFPPHWVMYVGVPRLEDGVAAIERAGGRSLSPIVEVPDVGRLRTMLDPQGAMFSILEPSSAPERPEAMAEVGEASWHELMTTDADAALTFYTGIFGWHPTEAMDMGPMGKYQMFGRAFPLGGMMNKPPEMAQAPPHWMIYFRVPDVNAAAERVAANGGQVVNGPMEVPGGSWIVNAMDPQGAAFSLHHNHTR